MDNFIREDSDEYSSELTNELITSEEEKTKNISLVNETKKLQRVASTIGVMLILLVSGLPALRSYLFNLIDVFFHLRYGSIQLSVYISSYVCLLASYPLIIYLSTLLYEYKPLAILKVKPKNASYNYLMGVFCLSISALLIIFTSFFNEDNEYGYYLKNIVSIFDDKKYFVIMAIVLCVIAPFLEEYLFRGCFIKMLMPFGEVFAVVFSALSFGLLHSNYNQKIAGFILGFFLGIYYIKSQSIYPCVIIHGLFNFLSLGSAIINVHGGIKFLIFIGAVAFMMIFAFSIDSPFRISTYENNHLPLKTKFIKLYLNGFIIVIIVYAIVIRAIDFLIYLRSYRYYKY